MSEESTQTSAAARELFAELLARHEAGEQVDWQAAFAEHPSQARALRSLHARWERLERVFSGLAATHSALDEVAADLRGSEALADEPTKRTLERLVAPDRGAERYVSLETLGRGGMGVVTRARDLDLEREVALKTIRADKSGSSTPDARALRRFVQEARIAAKLEHPAILPVHDIGIDARGRVYFTMPLVRGATLAQVLERGPAAPDAWSLSRKLEAVLKVCDALAYAHAHGVVHRDLKPANVLVGTFGEVYVTDWGLARVLRGSIEASAPLDEHSAGEREPAATSSLETAHGAVLGTAAYMAPEQARGEQENVGARADVYGVGALLYHVLAGRLPYADASERESIERVRRGPPPALSTIAPDAPDELISICERAMARRIADRYRDCTELAEDLRAYSGVRVVRAHESGAWPELRKWFRRNRAIAITSLVAFGAALIGLLATLGSETRARREILRLSDAQRLAALEVRAEHLWPALPAQAAAMQAWIDDAEQLLVDLSTHAATLARLREGARPAADGSEYVFANPEDQWRHNTLAELVKGLQRLASGDPARNALADVRARLELATTIERRSIDDRAREWSEAREAIAASPVYGGLELDPQLGLVPLGVDAASGLWEFAHIASGGIPRRRADGSLATDAASGVVLVLVPGGRFTLGSTTPQSLPRNDASDERSTARPDVDLLARDDETPALALELDPFFIAKHEMTQAQWSRLTRTAPSHHAGSDGVLPVETISWLEADTALKHAGLRLPTEAQWEFAARGATTTRFWFGRETSALAGRVNGGWGNDGMPLHTGETPATVPVDQGAANAWGLLHVLGNTAEWVEDGYAASHADAHCAGDGFAPRVDALLRVVRGGAFDNGPRELRVTARRGFAPQTRSAEVGVRAARRLSRGRSA